MSSKSSSTAASCSALDSPGALIFLHGLGDTPAGWSELEYSLPQMQSSLSKLRYVFPPAPTISITINGGAQMPGWFDLYDWPIGITAKDDPKGLDSSVQQIHQVVQDVVTKHGIPKNRIVIGGFSQGGAIALLAAYEKTENQDDDCFAGCVALSGWLTKTNDLQISEKAAQQTPLFWGHGQFDDKVLFEQQAHGIAKLTELGVQNIQSDEYPMGHSSHPKELQTMASFIQSVLFGNTA